MVGGVMCLFWFQLLLFCVNCYLLPNRKRINFYGQTDAAGRSLLERSDWLKVTDRKSTRLNSSHGYISYAVFCLKKKKKIVMKMYVHRYIYTMRKLFSIKRDDC